MQFRKIIQFFKNTPFREIPPRAPIISEPRRGKARGASGGARGGGGVKAGGPAQRPAPYPARSFFFFVAQWLKRPQCVAMLPCQQRQTHTMYLQITTHCRAKYSQLASKPANELLRSSRVKLSIISLGFCIIGISDECTSSLPFIPVLTCLPT